MGIFNFHYDRPGPGIAADAPRKKGAARFVEVVTRDFLSFYCAGGLALFSALPFFAGLWFAVTSHSILPLFAAGILGGMIAAPQLVALDDTILRSLRDEPGYWWATYRRVWRQNAKASLMPGAIFGLLLAMQVFTAFHSDLGSNPTTAVVMILSMVVLCGLSQYFFMQIPLVDLTFGAMLKNAVMFFLGFLPRTALCVLFQALYWGALVLLWPISGILLAIGTLWLPASLSLLAVYSAVEKNFGLEEKISALREERLESRATPENTPETPSANPPENKSE